MLQADLHVHSIASSCGLHTILELLAHADRMGMKAIAITDHGPALSSRLTTVFFERFLSPYPEITVYKGLELNVLDESGSIDFPKNFMPFVDLVLLGIHPNITAGKSREFYTDMLVSAIKQNPCVDIISHPNDPVYPVDYDKLAKTAQSHGIALELNNSKLLYKRTTLKETEMLIAACHINNCLLAVNTDTHAIHELGNDDAVRPILARMKFPEELIVNRTADSAADFIRKRRGFKLTKNA